MYVVVVQLSSGLACYVMLI